jgi:hypothetical protein
MTLQEQVVWFIYAIDDRIQPAAWRWDDGRNPAVQAADVVNLIGATLIMAWRGAREDEE